MSTSRKRNKASKGKKSSPGHSTNTSRSSLTSRSGGEGGDGPGQMMPDLQEPGDASERAAAENLQGKADPKTESQGGGKDKDKPRGGGARGQEKGAASVKSKVPAARMVYFDPKTILPPADKRHGE